MDTREIEQFFKKNDRNDYKEILIKHEDSIRPFIRYYNNKSKWVTDFGFEGDGAIACYLKKGEWDLDIMIYSYPLNCNCPVGFCLGLTPKSRCVLAHYRNGEFDTWFEDFDGDIIIREGERI